MARGHCEGARVMDLSGDRGDLDEGRRRDGPRRPREARNRALRRGTHGIGSAFGILDGWSCPPRPKRSPTT